MLLTISTVLDSLANVTDFVQDNVSMGVSHLVVFLDAPHAPGQGEVAAYLRAHPQVSVVLCDTDWWGGARPEGLNDRQVRNVNAALTVVRQVPGVEWIFHIDGDEVVAADPATLAKLAPEVDNVLLSTFESVSTLQTGGRQTLFKRPLSEQEVALLGALGLLSRPYKKAATVGHNRGKSGIRVTAPWHFALHNPRNAQWDVVLGHTDPQLRLLHHHSISSREMAAKAARLNGGGSTSAGTKGQILDSYAALAALDLPAEDRLEYEDRIFAALVADPVKDLDRLGMLVQVEPASSGHPGPALAPDAAAQLERGLGELVGIDKARFSAAALKRSAPAPSVTPQAAPTPDRAGRNLLRRVRGRG